MKHRKPGKPGKPGKLIALALASGIFFNSCATYQYKPMSKEEWLWLGASALVTTADIASTYTCLAEYPEEFYESNGSVGEKPSLSKLVSHSILTLGLEFVLGEIFPKYRKRIYQSYTVMRSVPAGINTAAFIGNKIRDYRIKTGYYEN